ncbi:MAG TPA: Gfo/Idh/MocA family oxidoreductase, partial [Candidatus Hydrogenedentes bacterium]|nr:Gfo/Idh/MocA family oxidoreductase [Candidatus Hydrogenedentota bacterium]
GMGVGWTDRAAESDRWEVAAYVDTNRRNLMAAAERHKMPKRRCFTRLDDALHTVEADALLDVTPQQFRKGVCCAAFKHGLDVMSEKPLADSLPNAQIIVRQAAQYERTYMVAQNYRYQAVVQTAKRFIAKGSLGEPGYVGVNFHKGPHFGGYRETMAYPLVLDMSIHHFDLMRCLFDADIAAVQATSISTPWNWNKGDATVMAQLELQNGVKVNYFASWVATGAETDWNAHWRIEGSKGVLIWANGKLTFHTATGTRRSVPLLKWPLEHQAYLLEAFADALDNGAEPETSGRRNLNSLIATYAVVRAAKQRRRVVLSDMLPRKQGRRNRKQ